MSVSATTAEPADRDTFVQECATELVRAFAEYNTEFRKITRRAPFNFASRDWKRSWSDSAERIELYDRFVNVAVARMQQKLGEDAQERVRWSSIKRRFAALIEHLPDQEFDKTFFNSVTRRTFGTAGVDAAVEFVAVDLDPLASVRTEVDTRVYVNRGSLEFLRQSIGGIIVRKPIHREIPASPVGNEGRHAAPCAEDAKPADFHDSKNLLIPF